MAKQGDDELDRAAILARRRRFIALAISGLASSGCKASPAVCLKVAAPHEPGDRTQDPTGDEEPMPQACLNMMVREDPPEQAEDPPEQAEDPEQAEEPEQAEDPEHAPPIRPEPCLNMRVPEPSPQTDSEP